MYLEFNVNHQLLIRVDDNKPVEKSQRYLRVKFNFSDDWNPLTKYAYFLKNKSRESDTVMVLIENNQCYVPSEVIKDGNFTIHLVGLGSDKEVVTTNKAKIILLGTGNISGVGPEEPYNPALEQLNAKIRKAFSQVESRYIQENGIVELTFTTIEGTKISTSFDLPTEQLVKDVKYDVQTKKIIITWENGQKTEIDMSGLVDTYNADGDTLTLTNHTFSLKKELKDKLDSIQENAQVNIIEKVKVEGNALLITEKSVNITKESLELEKVDNTSDVDKPVSTYQQEAINQALESAKNYTDTNGGKIDKIKVNNVEKEIINKTVDIEIPTKSSDLLNDDNVVKDANYKHITVSDKSVSDGENTFTKYDDTTVKSSISDIEKKIPNQASNENQLADKNFVNSSIATNTASFLGSFDLVIDLALLQVATNEEIANKLNEVINTKTNNDYCYVYVTDSVSGKIKEYRRFKYSELGLTFKYEYTLNNSSYTQEQWDAINSGITNNDVTLLNTLNQTLNEHISNVSNPHNVTKEQVGLPNVDNTSDLDKPVSNAQSAINTDLYNKINDFVKYKEYIPAEASSTNKLTDKNYVTQFVSEKMAQISSGTAIHSYDMMFALFAQYIYDKVITENGSSAEVIEALKNAVAMRFQIHTGEEKIITLGDALNNAGLDINNIMSLVNYNYIDEIVKNINGTYLMSISSLWEFNSDINIVEMFENHGITEMEPLSQYFKLKNANIGDNIYFVSPNVPDLWVATKTNVGIMYGSLDSKVDLSNIQNSISDIENNVNGLLNGDIILNKVKNADNAYRDSENNIISTYYASNSALAQAKSEIAELKETLYGYVLDTTDVEISNIIPYTTTIRNNTYNLVDNVYGLVKEVRGNTIKSENLLILEDKAETTINGITYSIKDGVITLNGTATAEFDLQYYFSSLTLNGNYSWAIFLNQNASITMGVFGYISYTTINNTNYASGIRNYNNTANSSFIRFGNGETVNNLQIKSMLVSGETAPTEFKQGFNGLKSVEYNGLNIVGANLLNIADKEPTTTNGITYSIKDGIIKLNGTSTLSGTINLIIPINLSLSGGDHSIYFVGNSGTKKGNVGCYLFNSVGTWIFDTWNFSSYTSSYKGSIANLGVWITQGCSFNNYQIKPMLVKGTTAPKKFKPYKKTTILPFNTILRGVGTAKDKIVITKNTNDEYYTATKISNVGEVDLGTLTWSNNQYLTNQKSATLPSDLNVTTHNLLHSKYSYYGSSVYENIENGIVISGSNIYIMDSDNPSGSLFYETTTPTTEVLSTTLTDSDVMPLLELGGSIEVGESEVKGSSKFEMVYRLSGINPTTTTEVLENEQ